MHKEALSIISRCVGKYVNFVGNNFNISIKVSKVNLETGLIFATSSATDDSWLYVLDINTVSTFYLTEHNLSSNSEIGKTISLYCYCP